jgi:hypothetical protein
VHLARQLYPTQLSLVITTTPFLARLAPSKSGSESSVDFVATAGSEWVGPEEGLGVKVARALNSEGPQNLKLSSPPKRPDAAAGVRRHFAASSFGARAVAVPQVVCRRVTPYLENREHGLRVQCKHLALLTAATPF